MAKSKTHMVVCCILLVYMLPQVGPSIVGRAHGESTVALYLGVSNVGVGYSGTTFNSWRCS